MGKTPTPMANRHTVGNAHVFIAKDHVAIIPRRYGTRTVFYPDDLPKLIHLLTTAYRTHIAAERNE